MALTNVGTKPLLVLYEKVKGDLIDRLSSPNFDPSESIGSERDLIKEFGVSRITIRRALSELEKDGLIYRIPGKGTFRRSAPEKAANRLMTVFLDSTLYKDEFFAENYAGIVHEAHRLGYHVMSGRAGDDPHSRAMARRMLDEYPSCFCFLLVRHPAEFIVESGIDRDHVMIIDDEVSIDNVQSPSVTCDNYQGGVMAMDHLRELGHKKIAFMTEKAPGVSWSSIGNRMAAWRDGVRQAGIEPVDDLIIRWTVAAEPSGESMLAHIRRLRPTAILCANDWHATNLVTVLAENGIRVPEEISVVGFDDIQLAKHLGLTTVRVPMRQMGAIAVKRAVNRLMGTDFGPANTVLPLELIVRKTTEPSV